MTRPSEPETQELAKSPIALLGGLVFVLSSLSTVRTFVIEMFGSGGVLAPIVVSISLFVVATYIALSTQKTRVLAAGFAIPSGETNQYRFSALTRRLALGGIVVAVVSLWSHVVAAKREFATLPRELIGIILDPESGNPVEHTTVRIVSSDGVDVTATGSLQTDSRGVFLLHTSSPVRRTASLIIYRKGCKPSRQALWRHFQTPTPSSLSYLADDNVPFFRVLADCEL